jgi:nucleoside-diphosphate-sugar epimerase
MRALVVGGTEFVGVHLVRALRRDGHDVVCLNRGRRRARAPAEVRTIVTDRTDHAALGRALSGERFDAVFDVAYAPTTGQDVAALLDTVALEPRGHVILVSSGRVYDHAQPIPFDETTPRNLYWGDYARNKIAGEDVLFERHRRGLPVSIVRPTHIMGPLNTRYNEMFFFDRITRGRPVLLPGHGGWLRQFGHVEDLADAMAAMAWDPRATGQAFNVTGEEAVTQAGLVELIAEVVGRPLTLVPVDPSLLAQAPGGPVFGQNLVYECHAVYTTAKLRQQLGFRPRYTLASALAQTYEWYRKEGLDRREVDFATDDALLKLVGA